LATIQLVQGDTLFLNSKYEYGNVKKAFASGGGFYEFTTTLETDTINFDRNSQVYYNSRGTVVNNDNTLRSKSGRYYVSQKKVPIHVLPIKLCYKSLII
jgi:hypothetical protein